MTWLKKLWRKLTGKTQVAGQVTVKGQDFYRSGKKWRIIGVSLDWAVQPHDYKGFTKLVDAYAELGINCFWAYASPGLGKPLYAGNSGGAPYTDNNTLSRNKAYWAEVLKRADYCNDHGITVVPGNTFPDQGVLKKYSAGLLEADWRATVKALKNKSVMFNVLSEYGEGGSAGVALARQLLAVSRAESPKSVITAHPNKTCADLRNYVDFISHQGYNLALIKGELGYGKPVVCAEHQGANDATVMGCFTECEKAGATYIITGRNGITAGTTMSGTLKNWIKSLK